LPTQQPAPPPPPNYIPSSAGSSLASGKSINTGIFYTFPNL
jgi:hypothetical protein